MSFRNERDPEKERISPHIHDLLIADIAGLDAQAEADYLHYRKLEFELQKFLWERPYLVDLVMAVNDNATFAFPRYPKQVDPK